jgi:hypothetical protein
MSAPPGKRPQLPQRARGAGCVNAGAAAAAAGPWGRHRCLNEGT